MLSDHNRLFLLEPLLVKLHQSVLLLPCSHIILWNALFLQWGCLWESIHISAMDRFVWRTRTEIPQPFFAVGNGVKVPSPCRRVEGACLLMLEFKAADCSRGNAFRSRVPAVDAEPSASRSHPFEAAASRRRSPCPLLTSANAGAHRGGGKPQAPGCAQRVRMWDAGAGSLQSWISSCILL